LPLEANHLTALESVGICKVTSLYYSYIERGTRAG